jgi:hypothetical protein
MTITKSASAAAGVLAALAWLPIARADVQPPPCATGQVVATALPLEAGVGHRGIPLMFSLSPGASRCTLTGYPGVDSGAGGPLIHAGRTLRGYLGGLPAGVDIPPTVVVAQAHPAQALVEGLAIDGDGNPCPTYTDLLVTAPDTTGTVSVPAVIDACQLQVHPVMVAAVSA